MRILHKTSGGMRGYERALYFSIREPGIPSASFADAAATATELLRSGLFGHGAERNFSVQLLESEADEIREAAQQLSKFREPVRKSQRPIIDGWSTKLALTSKEKFLSVRWECLVQDGWKDIQLFEKLLSRIFWAAKCRRLCAVRKGWLYEFYYEGDVRYYAAISAACAADVTWREFLERIPVAARVAAHGWAWDFSRNTLLGEVDIRDHTPIRNIPISMLLASEFAEPPNPVSIPPCMPDQVAALTLKEGAEDILRVPSDKYDLFCDCMRQVGYTISELDERLIRPILVG